MCAGFQIIMHSNIYCEKGGIHTRGVWWHLPSIPKTFSEVEFLLTHWYFLLRQLKLTWSDLKGKNSGGGDILIPYTLYEPLEVICVTTWKCVD